MSFLCAWTQQEDDFLKKIVPQGKKNWIQVSKAFNQNFGARNKTPKQCRERFVNYSYLGGHNCLNVQWSQSDFDTLFKLYEKYGSKWRKISSYFPLKSQNSIKNKFYGSIRKFVRKLNTIGKNHSILKKQMKEKSVLRVLDSHLLITLPENLKKKAILLKAKLLRFSKENNIEISDKQMVLLIQQINSFNLESRSYKFWSVNGNDQTNQEFQSDKKELFQYQTEKNQKNQKFHDTQRDNNQDLGEIANEKQVNKQQDLVDLSNESFSSLVNEKHLAFQLINESPIKILYSDMLDVNDQVGNIFCPKNLF